MKHLSLILIMAFVLSCEPEEYEPRGNAATEETVDKPEAPEYQAEVKYRINYRYIFQSSYTDETGRQVNFEGNHRTARVQYKGGEPFEAELRLRVDESAPNHHVDTIEIYCNGELVAEKEVSNRWEYNHTITATCP